MDKKNRAFGESRYIYIIIYMYRERGYFILVAPYNEFSSLQRHRSWVALVYPEISLFGTVDIRRPLISGDTCAQPNH